MDVHDKHLTFEDGKPFYEGQEVSPLCKPDRCFNNWAIWYAHDGDENGPNNADCATEIEGSTYRRYDDLTPYVEELPEDGPFRVLTRDLEYEDSRIWPFIKEQTDKITDLDERNDMVCRWYAAFGAAIAADGFGDEESYATELPK